MLQTYEEREGKFFMYNDERFINKIERQWSEFKGNKKNVQQAKVFS